MNFIYLNINEFYVFEYLWFLITEYLWILNIWIFMNFIILKVAFAICIMFHVVVYPNPCIVD